jgi:hypothetical protein
MESEAKFQIKAQMNSVDSKAKTVQSLGLPDLKIEIK